MYDFSVQNQRLKDKISLEKSLHQNQISEILKRYDSLKENREVKKMIVKEETKSEQENSVKPHLLAVHTAAKKVKANKLKAINVSARAVRVISKDVVETSIASKIDQVRVRFTLEENKGIEPGDKQLFIQIVNPKNRLLALKGKFETKLSKAIYYNRMNTDACMFIDLHQHQLIVGDYKVNLISNGEIIGSTNFRVN